MRLRKETSGRLLAVYFAVSAGAGFADRAVGALTDDITMEAPMFLEHVNMTVTDLERSVAFYENALGLRVRWRGHTADGSPAAHVGDDKSYLALFESGPKGSRGEPDYDKAGLNHFGWVVDDLAASLGRLSELGVKPHYEAGYEPGRRAYFFDPDGIEVELVEYPS